MMIVGIVVVMDLVDGIWRRWFGGGLWMCCVLLIVFEVCEVVCRCDGVVICVCVCGSVFDLEWVGGLCVGCSECCMLGMFKIVFGLCEDVWM